ncbi:secondary thiamine-phosphate synthase enzyme YjbQ [Flexibacterium corallicola]|uniref:secondary thiamine-phosphate synthase enzyme YjbQ n=1 Tax=Flexibacterium corallicola TaxID=3037259 RepID=UPI00286ECEB3|nr:secondary thiamine-phosphate synthase enzyme YjbQ [Pseudovibrio sp. M1P-2-3]
MADYSRKPKDSISQTFAAYEGPLKQYIGRLHLETKGKELLDIRSDIDGWLRQVHAKDGLLTIFVRHTSASLIIQENADPRVQLDLQKALDQLAPENNHWLHCDEGPDDMPAHVKTILTSVSEQIPVLGGRMDLGIWQTVYLAEHRYEAHHRSVTLHYVGD